MADQQFNLFKFRDPKIKTLHLTWFAFFLSFMVWFSHAPLLAFIRESMSISDQEIKVLLILNVAFTIPARIIVGILVDKYGPKQLFSTILILGGIISIGFACAQNYQQLAIIRFFLGFVGAGFVVGIRMISEWFPARQTGIAQGIYGGWGNFGSAGAALMLPALTLYFGGVDGWRYAIATTGCIAILYGIIYFFSVSNTPKGSTYFRPKKTGGMEVSSKKDLLLYILMNLPLYLTLAAIIWKLADQMHWLSPVTAYSAYGLLLLIYCFQTFKVIQINKALFHTAPPEHQCYSFSQVATLNFCYLLTFGTELAVVSMLPLFYVDNFHVEPITAGLLAGIYPVINLIARPAGGWLSDKIGRKNNTHHCNRRCFHHFLGPWAIHHRLATVAFRYRNHYWRPVLPKRIGRCFRDGTPHPTPNDRTNCRDDRCLWQHWRRFVFNCAFYCCSKHFLFGHWRHRFVNFHSHYPRTKRTQRTNS